MSSFTLCSGSVDIRPARAMYTQRLCALHVSAPLPKLFPPPVIPSRPLLCLEKSRSFLKTGSSSVEPLGTQPFCTSRQGRLPGSGSHSGGFFRLPHLSRCTTVSSIQCVCEQLLTTAGQVTSYVPKQSHLKKKKDKKKCVQGNTRYSVCYLVGHSAF